MGGRGRREDEEGRQKSAVRLGKRDGGMRKQGTEHSERERKRKARTIFKLLTAWS